MIRKARPEDAEALRALMTGSGGYAEGAPRRMIEAFAATWTPDGGPDEEAWVLEGPDGVAAGLHQIVPHAEHGWALDLFFTAADRRGAGLGRRMFEHALERVRARGGARLLIVSNPPAAGFYRRMGAREIGTSPPEGLIAWPRPMFLADAERRPISKA